MPGLNDLPNEILLWIVDYIVADENPTQKRCVLVDLLRVNQRLYEFVLPLVYSEFSDEALTFPMTRQVRGWARTIIEDDGKASLVRSVSIAGQYDFWTGRWENIEADGRIFSKLTAEGERRVRATIAEAFPHKQNQQSKWLQKCLVDHETNSLLALAIVRLPNLRFLTLGCHVPKLWLAASALVYKLDATRTLVQLDTLKVVSLRKEPTDDPRPLALAASWPNGRTLVGVGLGMQAYARVYQRQDPSKTPIVNFSSLRPRSKDLRAIVLRPDCRISSRDLWYLLNAAKAPEVFNCHVDPISAFTSLARDSMDPFGQALSLHQTSLKDVTVHVTRPDYYRKMEGLSFGAFTELRRLEICFHMFFNSRSARSPFGAYIYSGLSPNDDILTSLPASLQNLSLVQCTSPESIRTTLMLFDLIERHRTAKFPVMEEVAVAVYAGDTMAFAKTEIGTRAWAGVDMKLTLLECRDDTNEGLLVGLPGEKVSGWADEADMTFGAMSQEGFFEPFSWGAWDGMQEQLFSDATSVARMVPVITDP